MLTWVVECNAAIKVAFMQVCYKKVPKLGTGGQPCSSRESSPNMHNYFGMAHLCEIQSCGGAQPEGGNIGWSSTEKVWEPTLVF